MSPVQSINCLFKKCLHVKSYYLVQGSTAENINVYSKSWKREQRGGSNISKRQSRAQWSFTLKLEFKSSSLKVIAMIVLTTFLQLTWVSVLPPTSSLPAPRLVVSHMPGTGEETAGNLRCREEVTFASQCAKTHKLHFISFINNLILLKTGVSSEKCQIPCFKYIQWIPRSLFQNP